MKGIQHVSRGCPSRRGHGHICAEHIRQLRNGSPVRSRSAGRLTHRQKGDVAHALRAQRQRQGTHMLARAGPTCACLLLTSSPLHGSQSTLLRVCAGLVRPSAGRLRVAAPRGYVCQNPDHQVGPSPSRTHSAFVWRFTALCPGCIGPFTRDSLSR